jgi:ATP-dependent RNA helicase DeaD
MRAISPREGAGARHREPASQRPGERRSRPEVSRAQAPARAREGVEGRRQAQGPRVPGMGASGRGPRRPPREEGKRPIQGAAFTGPGAGKSAAFKETSRKPAGAGRPGRESWGRGETKAFAFKPGDRKTAAPRSRGKVFDKGFEPKLGTQRPAGPVGGDRKPQRSYGRQGIGEAPAREKSFDKGFGPKPGTQRPAGPFGGDRKPQRSYGRQGTGEAPARGKAFDRGFAPKPGAQRTAGPVGGDRKPQRSYGRPESGKAPVRGGGRKPYRSR